MQILANEILISSNVNFFFRTMYNAIVQVSSNQCYYARKHIRCMVYVHKPTHSHNRLFRVFGNDGSVCIYCTKYSNGMRTCAHTQHPFRATRRLQLGTQAVTASTFIVQYECFICLPSLLALCIGYWDERCACAWIHLKQIYLLGLPILFDKLFQFQFFRITLF